MAKSAGGKRKAPSKAASKQPASAAAKGCCTIESPGGPDRDVENITQAECTAIQNAHQGSVTHWVKGSCA
jgi:hypothetical protein